MTSNAVDPVTAAFTTYPPTKYPPVEIDPTREIRLLELLNTSGRIEARLRKHKLNLGADGRPAPIRCTPEHRDENIVRERWFTALSYCWGGFHGYKTIRLDDVEDFPVSRNLFNALFQPNERDVGVWNGRTWKHTLFWIDQICIDQHNVEERNQQVQIMGQIFNQAREVVVWLGETDVRERKMAVQDVFGRQPGLWPTRTWVIQEFALARRLPIVLFGSNEMSWPELEGLMRVVGKRTAAYAPGPDQQRVIQSMVELSSVRNQLWTLHDGRSQQSVSLSEVAPSIVKSGCVDPRDKVFGALTLVSELRAAVKADYTKATSHVFAEATYAIMCGSEGLSSLQRSVSMSGRETSLPTWVFDFEYPWLRTQPTDPAPWHAIWTQTNKQGQRARMEYIAPTTLLMPGLILDSVGAASLTGRPFPDFGDASETVRSDRFIHAWDRLCSQFGKPFQRLGDGGISPVSDPIPLLFDNMCSIIATSDGPVHEGALESVFEEWTSWILHREGLSIKAFVEKTVENYRWSLEQHSRDTVGGNTFFVSRAGFFGVGTARVRPGDQIAAVDGSAELVILRSVMNETWQLQGFAYVHGLTGLHAHKLLETLKPQLTQTVFAIV